MTPKEKAIDLVSRFEQDMTFMANVRMRKPQAKQCALIAVDYLIKEQDMWQNGEVEPVKYWQSVKSEIEKL